MAGTSTCTPHQVSFEGTVWVRGQVDLADALDLDTALSVGAARLADLGSAASLDVRRSEALGEMARHQLALDLDTTGDTRPTPRPPRPDAEPAGGAACPPLRGRDHAPRTPGCTWRGWRTPAPSSTPTRSATWCGRPGHHGDREAGGRPGRAPPRRPVPGPRPARRPGHRTRPDVCVPVVHPPRGEVRHGPCDPVQRGRADGERQHRPRCAGATTGSRPTTPAGATRCWNPGPICGIRRTATSSCATTAAPPTSPATGHAPARRVATPPHTPRQHPRRGAIRHVSRSGEPPGTTSPTPACEQRVSVWAGRCGRGAAGRERKRRRGGAGVRNHGRRRRRHGNSSDCR